MGNIEFKQIDITSAAKVTAAIMAIFGFLMGLLVAIFGSTAAYIAGAGALGAGFGIASIVIFPIMMAIYGFVIGAISAFLYNIVAERIGGIKVRT